MPSDTSQTTGVWIFNTEMATSTAVCKSIERLSGRKIVLGPPFPEGRHTSSLTHVGVYYEQQGMQKVMTEIPTTSTSRVIHQTSIMVMTCLLGQFAEQMHPNMLKDVRWAIEGNQAALKELDHAD